MIINGTITIQNLREMAKTDPARLLRLIEQKELKPTAMTFAVEIAGEYIDKAKVVPVILPLLDHPAPMVREGVIYGLTHHLDESMRAKLEDIAEHDTSPGVREAARGALKDLLELADAAVLYSATGGR